MGAILVWPFWPSFRNYCPEMSFPVGKETIYIFSVHYPEYIQDSIDFQILSGMQWNYESFKNKYYRSVFIVMIGKLDFLSLGWRQKRYAPLFWDSINCDFCDYCDYSIIATFLSKSINCDFRYGSVELQWRHDNNRNLLSINCDFLK